MAGIAKVQNRISIGDTDQPYDGQVVDLQYSISFQGPSSVAATIANAAGSYDITKKDLNSEKPVLVEFGPYKMNVLATSYRQSKGSGGRTLTINYEDMSLKYLDKNNILLKYQHLEEARGGATLVLGVLFADDEQGVSRRYFGKWIPGGVVRVQYDIRDVAEAIDGHDIPISQAFYDYLRQFKAYVKDGDEISAPASFLRSEVGSLRSVLGAIASELGFVFFWNNEDGHKGGGNVNPDRFSPRSLIMNKKENEGFLDFIRFETTVDIDQINEVADKFSLSCNVQDDTSEVSIKDSFLRGGVGYFSVKPPPVQGRIAKFSRFKFQEELESPHTGESVTIKDNYGLELLFRAALLGGDFYKKYVLEKLTASYMKDMADMKPVEYFALKRRNQPELEPAVASRISQSIRDEAGADIPLNMVVNDAVDTLYKGAEFDIIPLLYSKGWKGLAGKTDWRKEYNAKTGKTPDSSIADIPGASDTWKNIFEDDGLTRSLRKPFEFKDVEVNASEFVGISCRTSVGAGNNKRDTALKEFLDSVESDEIFTQIKFLAENYGAFFFQGTRTSGKLITQELFNRRSYGQNAEWVFSDMASFDTPVGAIFNFTQDEFKTLPSGKTGDSIYKARGVYEIMKEGQSICGKPSNLPGNVLSPQDRVYRVGEDNTSFYPADEEEEAQGYRDIMGIYSFLGKTTDIIQSSAGNPKQTGCNRGLDEDNEIQPIYDVDFFPTVEEVKGLVLETFRRRSDMEIEFGNTDDPISTQLGDPGQAINSRHYQEVQNYRTSCNEVIHPQEELTTPTTASTEDPDTEAQFSYQTDKDYGVVTHNAGRGSSVDGGDTDISYASYNKSTDANKMDLWRQSDETIIALEVTQWPVDEEYDSEWGRNETDYWDAQLLAAVSVNVPLNQIQDRKYIGYSLTVDDYLQSLRAAYVADSSNKEIFEAVSSVQIEDVPFDIGALLALDAYRYEFPVCEEGDERKALLDLQTAGENLMKIMEDYVEVNANPSISRDFVVSGYGFKESLDSEEQVPTIYQGLESIGIQLSADGVQTTIKIGNKRRMRASAQLRAQMIAKGMPGATASRTVPNQVNNAFSTTLQARL